MNKERRVGRRSVVRNFVKLTPEYSNEEIISKGPKKALFNDDTSFIMRRTLKPLHETNNLEFSLSKSKSQEKLYENDDKNAYELSKPMYMDMFNKCSKIPLSPPSRVGILEASTVKSNLKEPKEPVLQSKDLFNALIDSPCTKYEKLKYNNALSSASKFLLNRHFESVKTHPDIFKEKIPEVNLPSENENYERNIPNLMDISITPKQDKYQSECQTKISNTPLSIEEIEELKMKEIYNIHQTKLQCCDLIKNRFNEIELEVEQLFGVMENKVIENYEKLLKKVQDENNDSTESHTSNVTVETVKEKNYTRMTGAFGILNNLNTDCSFLKTPKAKIKTREEMLNKGILTPGTMSFVLQEQLMHLNSSS